MFINNLNKTKPKTTTQAAAMATMSKAAAATVVVVVEKAIYVRRMFNYLYSVCIFSRFSFYFLVFGVRDSFMSCS